jgi:hypothetical protein
MVGLRFAFGMMQMCCIMSDKILKRVRYSGDVMRMHFLGKHLATTVTMLYIQSTH